MPDRPRLLALCGARSNNNATKLQLENLQITDAVCDVFYLHGDIEVDEESSELYGVVQGPFYSWFDVEDEVKLNESILNSVRTVLDAIAEHGPFDGVYGFSNGALIAALVAGIAEDTILKEALRQHVQVRQTWGNILGHISLADEISPCQIDEVFDTLNVSGTGHLTPGELSNGLSNMGVNTSLDEAIAMVSHTGVHRLNFHSIVQQIRESTFRGKRYQQVLGNDLCNPPFKFCVLGCGALSQSKRFNSVTCSGIFSSQPLISNVKSLHLIGIEDDLKAQGEALTSVFENVRVLYLPGGHAIGRESSHDDVVCSALKDLMTSDGCQSRDVSPVADFKHVSKVSAVSLHAHESVVLVEVNERSLLPGGPGTSATIVNCLAAQPEAKIFIFNARNGSVGATNDSQSRLQGSLAKSFRRRVTLDGVGATNDSQSRLQGSLAKSFRRRVTLDGVGATNDSQSRLRGKSFRRGVTLDAGSFAYKKTATRRFGSFVINHNRASAPDLTQLGVTETTNNLSASFTGNYAGALPPNTRTDQDKKRDEHGRIIEAKQLDAQSKSDLFSGSLGRSCSGESPRRSSVSTDLTSHDSNIVDKPGYSIDEGLDSLSTVPASSDNDPRLSETSHSSCYHTQPKLRWTTYGDVLHFILHGEGDLRRIGVKAGEVVAYCAPGASSVAAVAFLTFGAQTTAAPLSPGMTEYDALDALLQFNAKHLVLFDGVKCPGVESAYQRYCEQVGSIVDAQIHTATIDHEQPGLFSFDEQHRSSLSTPSSRLCNPAEGISVLLRTSGTTSRPKGVPLKQGALVRNGAIIAHSLKLSDSDVCYSVMPLFHIGGISASVLCTLTSGGAICCDGEPFEPSLMVDALAASTPQPTWYSAVPTIHNALVAFIRDPVNAKVPKLIRHGIKNSKWKRGHSLRFVRSGAAALLGPDATALSETFGNIRVYPTYSMSEQMPISQPPAYGSGNPILDKPGSVGVPIAASLAIVNRANYRPLPHGAEGEIAICGATVMTNYLKDVTADGKSFFHLTLPGNFNYDRSHCRFFLTGDVGRLDTDGFLYISGRAKELIKKSGEQISPHQVEELLSEHPWIETPMCFGIPSAIYGEEVGCAVVLSKGAPEDVTDEEVIKTLRKWVRTQKLAPYKYPTKWLVVEELPRTSTKKLVRVNAAQAFGLISETESEEQQRNDGKTARAVIDWKVISSFRFCLACYVMFMHIGSNETWGRVNALRGFPWHVHTFFTLGGFSLASPMNPIIVKKLSYVKSRIRGMYPQYILAVLFGLVNLLVVCRPSTFRNEFHWDAQNDDLYQPDGSLSPMFCEGTPLFKQSYWANLISTVVIYTFGIAVTPFWPANWWLGYYLWFSSMYYQCIAIFPSMYNYLYDKGRKKKSFLLKAMVCVQLLNVVIIIVAWFSMGMLEGYRHSPDDVGGTTEKSIESVGVVQNVCLLSFYLTGPFWALYFIMGILLAFLYDAFKPANKHNARLWGHVADTCTLIQVILSIIVVCDAVKGQPKLFRPAAADEYSDSPSAYRLWDNLCGRIQAPLITIWIYALATGSGFTANVLRHPFLVSTLAPLSYNCFLYHQMVAQWYYAATRDGSFWNWWNYRKAFYWFSPEPCPVEWYEYFTVVGIVCFFSSFVDSTLLPAAKGFLMGLWGCLHIAARDDEEEVDIQKMVFNIIENVTGIEPEMDFALDEVGLASVGIPIIVRMLNGAFSKKNKPLGVTGHDLIEAKTIRDIVGVVENAESRMQHRGV